MLFDDDEQLEVRHVISLAHHDISIYSGEPVTPEGELWIKRNAICLSRHPDGPELGKDTTPSKPFYLFSENCSAKEDFYFALLRNQEQSLSTENKAPTPIQFDVRSILSLVQKLHSSEEQVQTRWLNAMIGRVFLGIHKTKDVESFIREKLTKKISRVKRPAFLSNIAIKAIDTGDSAPYITNPRLKDLTVEGECGMEADMRYTGKFRLEVAATARIDLGSRFKPVEVNLVLAVVLRKLEGHALFKIKPPPSNRIWFSFQQMPKIEMTIEPIVSSRQITYTVILRQIENRIKEVIAESIVLPFWDDTPFFSTEHKKWRGGIFHDDTLKPSTEGDFTAPQEGEQGEPGRPDEAPAVPEPEPPESLERSHSAPVLEKVPPSGGGLFKKLSSKRSKPDLGASPSASSSSVETKAEAKSSPPPALAIPFTQPSPPTVEAIPATADEFRPSSSPPSGSSLGSAMSTLSANSQRPYPPGAQSPDAKAFKPYVTSKSSLHSSSSSSRDATDTENDTKKTPQPRRNTTASIGSHNGSGNVPQSPTSSTKSSGHAQTGSISRGFFGRRDTVSSTSSGFGSSPGTTDSQKRTATALNAVANVAATAKRWGINTFQRRANDDSASSHAHPTEHDLSQPMGRGLPLPPPGTPLPMPEKKTPTAPIPFPKRKPVAPTLPTESSDSSSNSSGGEHAKQPTKEGVHRRPLPLSPHHPARRYHQDSAENNMLVVAAPEDSEPTTPLSAPLSPAYVAPWVVKGREGDAVAAVPPAPAPAMVAPVTVTTATDVDVEKPAAGEETADVPSPTEAEAEGETEGSGVGTPESEGAAPEEEDDYSAWMEEEGGDDNQEAGANEVVAAAKAD